MLIWSDLNGSETWVISMYKNRLECCDKLMAWVQTNGLGDAMCGNVWKNPGHWLSNTKVLEGSWSVSVNKDKGRWSTIWWGQREGAFMLIPGPQEIQLLFAHMNMLHQHMINIWPRGNLVRETVWGIPTPIPPGVEVWTAKIRIDCSWHRHTEKQQQQQQVLPAPHFMLLKWRFRTHKKLDLDC